MHNSKKSNPYPVNVKGPPMNPQYRGIQAILGNYEAAYLDKQGPNTIQRLEHAEYNAHNRAQEFLERNFGHLSGRLTLRLEHYELHNTLEKSTLEVEFLYSIHESGGRLRENEMGNSTLVSGVRLMIESDGNEFRGQFVDNDLAMVTEFKAARIIDKTVNKR